MPISDAAINALPLGKDVYDDLTYCLQEWQTAGSDAVMALPDPEAPSSQLDWVISLVGNLAWAATVFFPPAFAIAETATVVRGGVQVARVEKLVYASASAATKATSMMGATVAAGVVSQLRQLGGKLNSPQGKRFLDNYLGSQVPDVLEQYASEADPWVQKDLINHLITQYSLRFHPHLREDLDAAFTKFYNSVAGGEERRRYVWNDFVFPGDDTTYDNRPNRPGGRVGLKNILLSQLSDALQDFDKQWEAYEDKRTHRGRSSGILRPFSPDFKFKGVPPKVQAQQEHNRKMLQFMMKK